MLLLKGLQVIIMTLFRPYSLITAQSFDATSRPPITSPLVERAAATLAIVHDAGDRIISGSEEMGRGLLDTIEQFTREVNRHVYSGGSRDRRSQPEQPVIDGIRRDSDGYAGWDARSIDIDGEE